MEANEVELRKRAKRRVQARTALVTNVAMYVVVNVGLFVIWALSGARYPWFLWPLLGWGVGIVVHVVRYYVGPGSPGEDRLVARALRRGRERMQTP